MFDCYHSSQSGFIVIVSSLSTFTFWFLLVLKNFFYNLNFFFFWSGWHIKKVQLIQRFKMCLLRHVFPNGTAFPWQNICFLPLHCLFTWSEKGQESKRQQNPGWRVCLENSQEQTIVKIKYSLKQRQVLWRIMISMFKDSFFLLYKHSWKLVLTSSFLSAQATIEIRNVLHKCYLHRWYVEMWMCLYLWSMAGRWSLQKDWH